MLAPLSPIDTSACAAKARSAWARGCAGRSNTRVSAARAVNGETPDDERDQLYREVEQSYKGYAGYQEKTDREIPVFLLEPKD